MKKILFVSAAIMVAVSQPGCKKEKKEEDITPLFQNTVWTGEIKYNEVPVADPFSLTFDGNGNFTIEERSGTSSGNYFTDKASNTVTVQLAKGTFKATVSNRQFSNITYGGTFTWKINNGQLNDDALPVLSNTLWKGNQIVPPNSQQPWQMRFLTDKLFNLNEGPSNFPYTRSGVNIRLEFVNSGYYFVIQPNNKIKGIFWDFFSVPGTAIYRSYDLTRQ